MQRNNEDHQIKFKHYQEEDYEAVCHFLIRLNQTNKQHIHWNWARFEWMYEHPECDKTLLSSIGLWKDKGDIVGASIYDMYFGEAFCAVLPGYETIYPDVLSYAYRFLKDENGLGIAICDENAREIETAKAAGFTAVEQTETIMQLALDQLSEAKLPEGLTLAEPDPIKDSTALSWLFWQGFDHGTDYSEFLSEKQVGSGLRKHLNPHLGLAAVKPDGDYAAFCCVWYHPDTDYAYVEPVCTIPSCRNKGIAKALLTEALRRARALGAKDAYVISDQVFYEKLGFKKKYHYTFYWKN